MEGVSDDGRPCACGCGAIIPPEKLKKHPQQRFASVGCGLRYRRQQPGFEEYRRRQQKRAMALQRLDRWAQPAYDKLQRTLNRRGDPLTRQQSVAIMIVLADVIRTAYRRGHRAGAFRRVPARQRRATGQESPHLSSE